MADLSSYINIAANGITTLENITPGASASPAPSINGYSITNSAGISGSGNIAGGNISATGNITGGNISTAGNVSVGNILGNGYYLTGVRPQVTATNSGGALNIMLATGSGGSANAVVGIGTSGGPATINPGTGQLVVAGATVGGYGLSVSGGGSPATGTITATGNITGANLITGGVVSATGNVSGNFFLGNGSQLTGITATSLVNGTSNVVTTNNGNVTIGIAGNAAIATFTGTGANVTGTLNATGDVTAQGTGSNIVRRAFGLVASDTAVTLDDLTVTVSSSTSQLTLSTSGSWQGTGWTETFAGGGTPTVTNWVNLPLNPGFNNASGSMTSQGNGCRCIISDQTPSAKVYQITVVRSGTTGSQWNISIERLV